MLLTEYLIPPLPEMISTDLKCANFLSTTFHLVSINPLPFVSTSEVLPSPCTDAGADSIGFETKTETNDVKSDLRLRPIFIGFSRLIRVAATEIHMTRDSHYKEGTL